MGSLKLWEDRVRKFLSRLVPILLCIAVWAYLAYSLHKRELVYEYYTGVNDGMSIVLDMFGGMSRLDSLEKNDKYGKAYNRFLKEKQEEGIGNISDTRLLASPTR